MLTRSRYRLWNGRDVPPVPARELRAGPVTALLEETDLRYIKVDGIEIVRRVYVAVRDEVWNTIPGRVSDLRHVVSSEDFAVTFQAHHRHQAIDFSWTGRITGNPDGTIRYTMDGMSNAAFRYCKIGLNIHHPPEQAGHRYEARTPEGPVRGVLPVLIEPQRLEGGRLTAMFPPYDALTIQHEDGLHVRFVFEGDLFEMQDHRNWIDANYKSYGTPLSVAWPMDAHPRQRMQQAVTVSVSGRPQREVAVEREELRIELSRPTGRPLPPIGLGMASHGNPLSSREVELLRRLRLDHLRVDLHLDEPAGRAELRRASEASAQLVTPLELAVFVNDAADEQLDHLADALREFRPTVVRVLVYFHSKGFDAGTGATPGRLVRLARERLRELYPDVSFAGGTNQFFAELNRGQPEIAAMDAVAYSISPEVHACDDESIVENLAAQADTVRTARSFCGDRPIVVSAVTLATRNGPYPAGPPQPDGLPPEVDVRQASLLGAAWTVGSVKYLAEGGVASTTYYETTGWRGVIETDTGSPMPERFPSAPSTVFPMYHVFADLADWKHGAVVSAGSTAPLSAEGLAIRDSKGCHLLVANLTPSRRAVTVGLLKGRSIRVRQLDEETAPLAVADPLAFRSTSATRPLMDGWLSLDLPPYAIVRIDESPES